MPASTNGCWHLYLDACRHLRVDAAVRLLRYLPLDARAAPGPGVQDDPILQAERDGAIVAQFPHPSLWVPRPTGSFTRPWTATSAKGILNPTICSWAKRGRGDSQSRSATRSSTVLSRFFRRAWSIAHADEAVTVLSEKLLRALLARPEMQPDRGAGGGPAGGLEEARYGGPMGLGSWTTDADLHRRPSDSTAYETGSSLNTLGM